MYEKQWNDLTRILSTKSRMTLSYVALWLLVTTPCNYTRLVGGSFTWSASMSTLSEAVLFAAISVQITDSVVTIIIITVNYRIY